jgi:drug/metabolite transporter (DMT)-like permease
MTIALYQDLFAAAVLLPFVFTGGQSITIYELLLLAVLGVLCTAVAHSLFIAGMHGVSARTASMIACLEPVYGALLAVLLLGDSLPLRTVLGGIVVLGVALHATVKPRG